MITFLVLNLLNKEGDPARSSNNEDSGLCATEGYSELFKFRLGDPFLIKEGDSALSSTDPFMMFTSMSQSGPLTVLALSLEAWSSICSSGTVLLSSGDWFKSIDVQCSTSYQYESGRRPNLSPLQRLDVQFIFNICVWSLPFFT